MADAGYDAAICPGLFSPSPHSAATVLMLLIFAASIVLRPRKVPLHIDVLLCSYSSNTAHFTGLFTDAANKAGAKVLVHRFHHYRGFTVRYKGDAFVIAFPVIGWKPPWPMLYYLILKLPWGGGKPAYVLYTAAGGPENTGTFVWLLLTLKGYRIAGRDWGDISYKCADGTPRPEGLLAML